MERDISYMERKMPNIYDMSIKPEEFNSISIQCSCDDIFRDGQVCSACKGKGYIIPNKDRRVYLIGAMSKNRVIGKNNKLPWKIPDDLKYFKKMTKGKTVIMGRKTFDSVGRPLPDRNNIVLTRDTDLKIPGVVVRNSLEKALLSCQPTEQVMIIGGSEIYQAALPYAREIYLTIIDAEYDGDAYFPEFSESEWEKTNEEMHVDSDPWFSINTFRKVGV